MDVHNLADVNLAGHRLAFEAGIIHRDVSEGNVMIANGRGFLHDLDYGFDWKEFLLDLGFEDTLESWEQFVATEAGIPRADASEERPPGQMAPASEYYDTGSGAPPRGVYVKGQLQWPVEAILAERQVEKRKEYLVKWVGYGEEENTWEPERHLRDRQALGKWRELTPERRRKMSEAYLEAHASGQGGTQDAQAEAKMKTMMECKQRTVR